MNLNELRSFAKEKRVKGKGFRAFGIIAGIFTILLLAGAVLLSLLKNDGTTVAYAVKVGLNGGLNDIVFYTFAFLLLTTIVCVLIKVIKMFSKKAKNSGNLGFFIFTALGVLLIDTAIQIKRLFIIDSIYFNYVCYALAAMIALVIFYNIVATFANAKVFKKSNEKLFFTNLLGILTCAGSIVVFYLLCMPALGLNDINAIFTTYKSTFLSGVIATISIMGVKDIPLVIVGVAMAFLFVFIAYTLLCFVLSIVRSFLNADYVRGSKYFRRSSSISALLLVALPLIIFACEIVYNSWVVPQTFWRVVIAFGIVLLLFIFHTAMVSEDKRRLGLRAVAPNKTDAKVVEPVEEIIDKSNEVVAEEIVTEEPATETETQEKVEETVVEEAPLFDNEEFVQEKFEEEKEEKKEDPAQNANANPYGQQFVPQGYYPYGGMGMPVYNANHQIIGYVPYPPQQPVQPVYAQPVQPVYAQPVYAQPVYGQPVYGQPVYQGQQPVQPVQQTVNEENYDDTIQTPLVIPKKTLEEKLAEITAQDRAYYKQIIAHAVGKVGTKHTTGVYADSVYYGRDLIVKVQIKQNKIVCQYQFVDFKVKEMLKDKSFSAKQEQTIVKVKDKASFEAAKKSIDMAYDLALEAKEIRHQEALKRRREARAAKKQ